MKDFKHQVPCFNATVPEFDLPSSSSATDAEPNTEQPSSSGKKSLSGGAIAGIAVGVVIGVGLLAGGAFFIWRLRNQRERLRAQEASVRAVKWDAPDQSSTHPSDIDVPLQDIPAQRP